MDLNSKVPWYSIGLTLLFILRLKGLNEIVRLKYPTTMEIQGHFSVKNQHEKKYSNEKQTHQVWIIQKLGVWRLQIKEVRKSVVHGFAFQG